MPGMSDFGDRLEKARGTMSQSELARLVGLKPQSIQAIETPARNIQSSKAAPKMATILGVRLDWLLYGDGPMREEKPVGTPPPREEIDPREPRSVELVGLKRDLPVRGRAVGGDDTWFEWNGEALDWIFRPPPLSSIRDAYAMLVDGQSMVPRYRPGETIYVNPIRPVRPGDCVVALLAPAAEGEMARALVKELVSRSGNEVILRSLNPPGAKPIKLPAKAVLSLHKIVLSGED